ncbi:MAG: hypothetical protein L0Y71_25965 [Gemmataceae bacterium]|nr:hypothetical protein [Gemmataceae bacterium]
MMHFTCDLCGKELHPGEDEHYVVKIEAFSAQDPNQLVESDLDDDHMEAVSALLQELEDADADVELPEVSQHLRYDLCCECHRRFLRDPLGKEQQHKLFFSKN